MNNKYKLLKATPNRSKPNTEVTDNQYAIKKTVDDSFNYMRSGMAKLAGQVQSMEVKSEKNLIKISNIIEALAEMITADFDNANNLLIDMAKAGYIHRWFLFGITATLIILHWII